MRTSRYRRHPLRLPRRESMSGHLVLTKKSGTVAPTLLFHSVSIPTARNSGNHAFKISLWDSTRSINGRIPKSLEMAKDSSNKDVAVALSPSLLRCKSKSA